MIRRNQLKHCCVVLEVSMLMVDRKLLKGIHLTCLQSADVLQPLPFGFAFHPPMKKYAKDTAITAQALDALQLLPLSAVSAT